MQRSLSKKTATNLEYCQQECCQVCIKNGNYIIFCTKKGTETFIHQHHIERPHKTAPIEHVETVVSRALRESLINFLKLASYLN